MKKSDLRNFTKLTGKHLCQSLFFNKVAALAHTGAHTNFAKFVGAPFLQNTSGGCFCLYEEKILQQHLHN